MRYCLHRGCPEIVRRGYCAAHAREYEQARGSQRARGYTRRWEHAAARFKMKHPLCGMRPDGLRPVMSRCYEQGIVTPATEIDHVIPHRGDQTLFWDELHNWQSLCASCHMRKTRAGL